MKSSQRSVDSTKSIALVLSCEHASFDVPAELRDLFKERKTLLESHRGWDRGAVEISRALSKRFRVPLQAGKYSRLVIDLNRSLGHPHAFSKVTRGLLQLERDKIFRRYHESYWQKLRGQVQARLQRSEVVLHLGVHSFTPVMKKQVRNADIGILFDPRFGLESEFCLLWQRHLQTLSDWRVRRNYPYLGRNNSLQTHFRNEISDFNYLGVELEINQKHLKSERSIARVTNLVERSLLLSIAEFKL